jgi:hypothetical protein
MTKSYKAEMAESMSDAPFTRVRCFRQGSAVPRIPTAAAFGLKDADPFAESLHVISWLLDTSPQTALRF